MAKRISEIARVQEFFETASIEQAKLMLEIISGIVKRRNGGTVAAPRKTRADKGPKRGQENLALDSPKEATA